MLGPHTHRGNPLSRIMCDPIAPPVTMCYSNDLDYFFVFLEIFFPSLCKMKKRNEKTNTGEGGKGKRGRNASDNAGGNL